MKESAASPVKPYAKDDVEAVLLDQELFLYNHNDQNTMHCLNSGAAVIWFLCDGTRDSESIASEIAAAYDVPLQQALTDVRETLMQFQALGLLESHATKPS